MAAPVPVAGGPGVVVIDWNPEPTKELAKGVYDASLTALAGCARIPAQQLAERVYEQNPLNEAVVNLTIERAKAAAKQATDAAAEACYATPDSWGARIAQWLGFPG